MPKVKDKDRLLKTREKSSCYIWGDFAGWKKVAWYIHSNKKLQTKNTLQEMLKGLLTLET